jgi:hypothetical protein
MNRPPDLLGIGAQRAGTTWLWETLRSHPDVWLPTIGKEIHYFDEVSGGGRDVSKRRRQRRMRRLLRGGARALPWNLRFVFGRRDDDWYRRLFAPAGDRLTADITPEYLALEPPAVRHAATVAPDARLVVMVRHPMERLWSVAWFFPRLRRMARTQDPELFVALARSYHRRMGGYTAGIARWREHYPADRVFVAFGEDLAIRPQPLAEAIGGFLGLRTPSPVPAGRSNRSGAPAIPEWALPGLVDLARPIVAAQADLGGYASWWARSLDHLAAKPGPAELPLHEGDAWAQWVEESGGDLLHSGRLDLVAPGL